MPRARADNYRVTVTDPGPATTMGSPGPGSNHSASADGAAVVATARGLVRRAWELPIRAHVAALAVVLLALVPVVGTGASFSADEGAVIIQARSLARGHGWIVEHPVPAVDPEG